MYLQSMIRTINGGKPPSSNMSFPRHNPADCDTRPYPAKPSRLPTPESPRRPRRSLTRYVLQPPPLLCPSNSMTKINNKRGNTREKRTKHKYICNMYVHAYNTFAKPAMHGQTAGQRGRIDARPHACPGPHSTSIRSVAQSA